MRKAAMKSRKEEEFEKRREKVLKQLDLNEEEGEMSKVGKQLMQLRKIK